MLVAVYLKEIVNQFTSMLELLGLIIRFVLILFCVVFDVLQSRLCRSRFQPFRCPLSLITAKNNVYPLSID
jgi:hypothetical protein